ncbi:ATP-grasp domain-containing protein [Moorella sulfitireducens]|uniref:ATP-grasp domain-containing protein n=1 Tax=Neomoorella sulfitireducens TaxID=2972948 RepID=UPI0021AC306D|nr:ATP-grasp domain-containing protein [Moorella sulfitireducens]
MRVLIFEYFSAGGTTGRDKEESLLHEGFSMLNAVLSDFACIPGLEILTVLDSRLQPLVTSAPYAGQVHALVTDKDSGGPVELQPCPQEDGGTHLDEEKWRGAFAEALEQCAGALVIAPETGGLLARLTAQVERRGKILLGSSAEAVATAGDKAQTLQLCREAGLLTPHSEVFSSPLPSGLTSRLINRFPVPAVVKPLDGAGSQGITVVRDPHRWESALKRVAATSNHPSFLVQEYVAGDPVSVSCLVVPPYAEGPGAGSQPGAGTVLPLTLNRQIISGDNLDFIGVVAPYSHRQAQVALDIARRACELIPGLAGYVGVDLVLSSIGPVVMEINPRVTVAYVALREVVNVNLARYILDACLKHRLPPLPQIAGQFTYRVSAGKNIT